MGLKRRAAGRKQVLDLNEKQDSPRRSWQTKYQQICVEHNTQNGNSGDPSGTETISSTSSKDAKSNPLSGLLANYHSDSDGDDEEKDTGTDLDSKVSDFMKEIQTIVPSGSSIVVPGQLITTPGIVDVNASQAQQQTAAVPVSAWQECYDETTGYIYYWHTETNAVTWETPAEYLPQAVPSREATDETGLQETSLQLSPMPRAQQGGIHHLPHSMHAWSHPGVPMGYPMSGLSTALPPQPVQSPGTNKDSGGKGIRPLVEYNNTPADKASSDSEEERIEMITSFGESSDEDSEEEIQPPVKRKKCNIQRSHPLLKGEQDMIGPKLQTLDDIQMLQPDSEQLDESSSLLSNQVDDFGPPGVEMETKIEEHVKNAKEQSVNTMQEESSAENSNAISEAEHEDDMKVTTQIPANENSSSEVDSTTESEVGPSAVNIPTESDGGDSTENDEVGILTRLRNQAQVLKELGGELPAEVQQLIEPPDTVATVGTIEKVDQEQSTESLEESTPIALDENIAVDEQLIVEEPEEKEPERLSQLPDFEKEMERMEEELKELTRVSKASASVESSPKTTSFALIAGYGDDSDQEDESEKALAVEPEPPVVVHKRTFESLPTVPVKTLFPIAEHAPLTEPKSPLSPRTENNTLDSDGLPTDKPPSPKVSHSILFPTVGNSTEVPLPALRLQESSEIVPETVETLPPVEPIIDSTLPKKAGKRKKRLDISTSAELVANSISKASAVALWTCSDSELRGKERKGLGFEKLEADADTFLQDCISEFESKKVSLPKSKENIAFVKGDVLSAPKPEEEMKEEAPTKPTVDDKVPEADSRIDEESSKLVSDLAQMILEKVTFLAEGKELPSPVQVMAIQIETLLSAWHVGGLSQSYLSKWLGETGDELMHLEASAAPEGWACQWDRPHKRYYYCNLLSGETQWEYPELLEETTEPEEMQKVLVPEKEPKSPQLPVAEDLAGGELAMEICNTPPHSPSPPPPPPTPSPPLREKTPPPPPPPTISKTKELSPPPPPRISPFLASKSGDRRRQPKGRNRKKKINVKKQQHEKKQAKKNSPKPPPDLNPPLPPLPPPPSSPPPPPPPSEMPPLPPSPPRQQLAYGEPLPPGVDPAELPYMAQLAPPPIYQSAEIAPSPTADMETYQHAMQTTYVMTPYQSTLVQSSMVQPGMASNVQGGPVMDYSGMPYMMHTHMPMPAVIAKPPAKKHKAALHAALNSFYSDLAIMEPVPPPEGVVKPAAVTTTVSTPSENVPATSTEQSVEPEVPVSKQVDPSLKKKKVKKVVGLGLKKKGVSSLVAKWQQVQQEVRRDFETLDQDNKSCQ